MGFSVFAIGVKFGLARIESANSASTFFLSVKVLPEEFPIIDSGTPKAANISSLFIVRIWI